MALSIRKESVADLAREISIKTGNTMTDTIEQALIDLNEKLDQESEILYKKISAIAEKCSALPDLSVLSEDELLGYDSETGA